MYKRVGGLFDLQSPRLRRRLRSLCGREVEGACPPTLAPLNGAFHVIECTPTYLLLAPRDLCVRPRLLRELPRCSVKLVAKVYVSPRCVVLFDSGFK